MGLENVVLQLGVPDRSHHHGTTSKNARLRVENDASWDSPRLTASWE